MKKIFIIVMAVAFAGCSKMPSPATMNAIAPCIQAVNTAIVYGKYAVNNPHSVKQADVVTVMSGLDACKPLVDAAKL